MLPNAARSLGKVFQVRRTRRRRRRPDRDKHDLGARNRFGVAAGESEVRSCFFDQICQVGFVNRNMTIFESFNFRFIRVEARHLMSDKAQTNPSCQPDITRPNDRNAHNYLVGSRTKFLYLQCRMITRGEYMKRLALCALSAMLCQIAFAQDSGKTLVNELVTHWETSKALSLAVAEAMPE